MGTRIVVMKDGLIQQVDNPQNLYDHPANLFVAGFIGMPPMNFFDVTLSKENGTVFASFGENKIQVPDDIVAKFVSEDYLEKQVIMGCLLYTSM